MSHGDPFLAMKAKLADLKPTMLWESHDVGWAERARAAVADAVGVIGEPWPAGDVTVGPEIQEIGYRRARLEFPSHSVWRGKGWLLTPDAIDAPAPAVVCLPGHGKGADAIVGLVDEAYQANFALQCVREGWVTLAVEQVSFGSNRSSLVSDQDSSCVVDSMAALLLGETVTGWRVRDAMAGLRAIRTLHIVDGDRVGVLGISGGGLTALWSGALDPGFLAVGVSGYFCPMAHSILNVYHCPDNYVPGFAKLMDVPDLAGLIAPRWLAVENGTEDPLFQAVGFSKATELARRIYEASSVPERFCSDLFEGDHVFTGREILNHFRLAFGA